MPETKPQKLIFTLMTVILMAYFMIVYTIAVNSETGLVNRTFVIALKEFPIEFIVVFILAFFIANPIALKLALRIFNPKSDNNMLVIIAIQTYTVCIMVALMSVYALFAQNLVNSNVICNWIVLACKNFTMAFPLQIFIVGPLVRNIFKFIYKKQLKSV